MSFPAVIGHLQQHNYRSALLFPDNRRKAQSAVELLHKIRAKYPARFDNVSLRTMQRERKIWNQRAAKRLIGEHALPVQDCRNVATTRMSATRNNQRRHEATGNILA